MKRNFTDLVILLSFIVLVFSSCKKNSTDSSVNLPIVEGYLIPGHALIIKLYQQKSLTDTNKYGAAITGLQVYVADGSKEILLTEAAKGTYTYADQSFLTVGKTYTLQFKYLAYAVSAKTVMPGKPLNFATQHSVVTFSPSGSRTERDSTLDKLTWDNPDSLNHVLVFNNADGPAFALGTFGGGGNRSANFELNTSKANYYNLTPQSFPYYGHYQIILMRVNKEYIDLIKSNTSNSTSQNLTNVPTNVVNGFGIFTAMQTDTLSFNLF